MCFQNMQDQATDLVLCKHAKPRLKWTPELHQRFVVALNELGGADKATPKSLMREMEIPGLTLYHLKSHLQKFRLGKNQQSEPCINFEDFSDTKESDQVTTDAADDKPINGSVGLAEALQMQIEVQQKLHKQIEVQHRLQLRIEAQGKYLQTVLQKARQTLVGYNSFPPGEENGKEDFSKSVSMVSSRCLNSSFSESTEVISSTLRNLCQREPGNSGSSNDFSLTSLDISAKEEKDPMHKNGSPGKMSQMRVLLPSWISGPSIDNNDRKRSGSSIRSGDSEEQSVPKRSSTYREKVQPGQNELGFADTFDLNSQCLNDMDLVLGPTVLDLNPKATERFNTVL